MFDFLWRGVGFFFGSKLRATFIGCFIIGSAATGTAFAWHDDLYAFLLAPGKGALSPHGGKPITTGITDGFSATLGLSVRMGFLAATPVFLAGLLWTVRDITTAKFHRWLVLMVAIMLALFVLGNVFVYWVLLPVSIQFLLTFTSGFAQPVITLEDYMAMLLQLSLGIGLVFQIPPAMYMLARVRFVSYRRWKNIRKYVPPTALIFAAIISPSLDGNITALVFFPIWGLYEIGVFAAWVANPSDGNYMWVKTIWYWIGAPFRAIRGAIRKARNVFRR